MSDQSPYQSIPPAPTEISTTNSLARFIDAIGFRYRWATEGLTENEIQFRPVESSKNTLELIKHIYDLVNLSYRTFGGQNKPVEKPNTYTELRNGTLQLCLALSEILKAMTDQELANMEFKGRMEPNQYWHMLNGPISDTLTHIGQITSWRRIAGNPQPAGVNVFVGQKS